jgi:hypothetical protein
MAQDRKKAFVNNRRKELKLEVGERVYLKLHPF